MHLRCMIEIIIIIIIIISSSSSSSSSFVVVTGTILLTLYNFRVGKHFYSNYSISYSLSFGLVQFGLAWFGFMEYQSL